MCALRAHIGAKDLDGRAPWNVKRLKRLTDVSLGAEVN